MEHVGEETSMRSSPAASIAACASSYAMFAATHMVARVLGVDRDDRQMREVLALAQRQLRHAMRFVDRLLREFVAQSVLVDRDQAEAARRERVAEHRVHAGAGARRPTGHLA